MARDIYLGPGKGAFDQEPQSAQSEPTTYNVERQLEGFDKARGVQPKRDVRVKSGTRGEELTTAVLDAGSYEFGTK